MKRKSFLIACFTVCLLLFSGCGSAGPSHISESSRPAVTEAASAAGETGSVQSSSAAETEIPTESETETAAETKTLLETRNHLETKTETPSETKPVPKTPAKADAVSETISEALHKTETTPPFVPRTEAAPETEAETVPEPETQIQSPEPVGEMVWLPKTGEKYHKIPDCGRMNPNTAREVSVDTALDLGYEPCKKCY